MKYFIFSLIVLCCINNIYSQQFEKTDEFDFLSRKANTAYKNENKLGLQASMFTGLGPVYHRNITDNLTVRVGFLAYGESSEDNTSTTDLYGTAGAALQLNISKNEDIRTFSFISWGYLVDNYSNNYSYYDYNTKKTIFDSNEYKNDNNIYGIGVGAELYFWDICSLQIETGFIFNKEKKSSVSIYYDKKTSTFSNKNRYGYALGVNFNLTF